MTDKKYQTLRIRGTNKNVGFKGGSIKGGSIASGHTVNLIFDNVDLQGVVCEKSDDDTIVFTNVILTDIAFENNDGEFDKLIFKQVKSVNVAFVGKA